MDVFPKDRNRKAKKTRGNILQRNSCLFEKESIKRSVKIDAEKRCFSEQGQREFRYLADSVAFLEVDSKP